MFVVVFAVFTFVFPKAEPVAGLPKALPPNILIAWKNTNEVSDERERESKSTRTRSNCDTLGV